MIYLESASQSLFYNLFWVSKAKCDGIVSKFESVSTRYARERDWSLARTRNSYSSIVSPSLPLSTKCAARSNGGGDYGRN